jgi:hypothetical protein
MNFGTVLTKNEQAEVRDEIIVITEHKIQMFKKKLAETPECYTIHSSIKKLIESNEARLEMLING